MVKVETLQRLVRLARSYKAVAKTALGQMLALLLQLGRAKKAGWDNAGCGFGHMLTVWAQQMNLKPQLSRGLS